MFTFFRGDNTWLMVTWLAAARRKTWHFGDIFASFVYKNGGPVQIGPFADTAREGSKNLQNMRTSFLIMIVYIVNAN